MIPLPLRRMGLKPVPQPADNRNGGSPPRERQTRREAGTQSQGSRIEAAQPPNGGKSDSSANFNSGSTPFPFSCTRLLDARGYPPTCGARGRVGATFSDPSDRDGVPSPEVKRKSGQSPRPLFLFLDLAEHPPDRRRKRTVVVRRNRAEVQEDAIVLHPSDDRWIGTTQRALQLGGAGSIR